MLIQSQQNPNEFIDFGRSFSPAKEKLSKSVVHAREKLKTIGNFIFAKVHTLAGKVEIRENSFTHI